MLHERLQQRRSYDMYENIRMHVKLWRGKVYLEN